MVSRDPLSYYELYALQTNNGYFPIKRLDSLASEGDIVEVLFSDDFENDVSLENYVILEKIKDPRKRLGNQQLNNTVNVYAKKSDSDESNKVDLFSRDWEGPYPIGFRVLYEDSSGKKFPRKRVEDFIR